MSPKMGRAELYCSRNRAADFMWLSGSDGLHIAIGRNCQYQMLWLSGDRGEKLWITGNRDQRPSISKTEHVIHSLEGVEEGGRRGTREIIFLKN